MGFFSSNKKTTNTSTNTTGYNAPAWLQDYLNQNVQGGMSALQGLANTTADERIQGFTPDELAAQERIRSGTGQYDDIIGNALQMLTQAQGKAFEGVNPDDIQKFMNPYTQNVTDITKRETVRDADIARAKMQAGAGASSAFGGSGGLLRQMELDRNLGQSLSDIQYKGQADAYNSALQAARQSTADTIAAGSAIGGLATTGANLYNQDTQALAASGEAQRGLAQAKTDFTYTNPLQTILQGQQLIQGAYPLYGQTSTGTTTTSTPGAGWGSQLLGSALAIGSLGTGGGGTLAGSLLSGWLGGQAAGSNSQPMSPMQSAANGITWLNQKDGGAVHMADGGEPKSALEKLNLFGRLNAFADARLDDYEKNGSLLGNLLTGEYKVAPAQNRLDSVFKAPAKAIAGAAATPYLAGSYVADKVGDAASATSDYFLTPYSELEKRKKITDEYKPGTIMPMPELPKTGLEDIDAYLKENPTERYLAENDTLPPSTVPQGADMLEQASQPLAEAGLTALASDKPVEKTRLQRMIDDTNLPLLKMGLTMMASNKPFFEAVGEGGLAGANQIDKERERETKSGDETLDRQIKLGQLQELIKNNAERREIARMRLTDAQQRTKIAQQNADIYASKSKNLSSDKKLQFENLKTQLKTINDRINNYTVSPDQIPSLEATQQKIVEQMNLLTGGQSTGGDIQEDTTKAVTQQLDWNSVPKK